jgi:DNA (cytosine-5)-methyltransferase 1
MPKTSTNKFSLLRQQAGLSIDELADESGFSRRTVYRWESGEAQPRAAVLRALEVLSTHTPNPDTAKPLFRFIDLFAGIGGLRRGF